mgnify:CR=1 FL=1
MARSSTGGPSPELAVSGYEGVVRHLRPTGKPYFEARAKGVAVSCHATDVEAPMAVAKKRRVSVESLKKTAVVKQVGQSIVQHFLRCLPFVPAW